MKNRLVLIVLVLFCQYSFADADISNCGEPPPVAEGSLKGELDGKAKLFLNFIGKAEFKGKIETSRAEVFSRYPDANKLVVDYYLLYQACVLVMKDESLSTTEKIKLLSA